MEFVWPLMRASPGLRFLERALPLFSGTNGFKVSSPSNKQRILVSYTIVPIEVLIGS